MAQYNIEMNSFNGSQYNQLYPRTLLNNITDWRNTLYTKTEIDSQKNEIMNAINETSQENGELLTSAKIQLNTSSIRSDRITLPKNVRNYRMLVVHITYNRNNIILGVNDFYLQLFDNGNSITLDLNFFLFPIGLNLFIIGAGYKDGADYMSSDSSPSCSGWTLLSSSRNYISVGGRFTNTTGAVNAHVYGY